MYDWKKNSTGICINSTTFDNNRNSQRRSKSPILSREWFAMTQRSKDMDIDSLGLKVGKRYCTTDKNKIEIMIRGYQEMAEINLTISRLCFEVESEADGLCIRPTECD